MADVEEPQFNTLAERIAALNKQKSFGAGHGPDAVRKKAPPPPPPGRPLNEARSQTLAVMPTNGSINRPSPPLPARPNRAVSNGPPPLPRRDTASSTLSTGTVATERRGSPQPPLPSRTNSFQPPSPSPTLPPRRSSTLTVNTIPERRNSASSDVSSVSTLSLAKTISSTTSIGSNGTTTQRKMVVPAYDPASLPSLPPTKRELEAKAQEAAEKEAAKKPAVTHRSQSTTAVRPSLPPRLPSRPANRQSTTAVVEAEPALPVPKTRVPIIGFKQSQPPVPGRPQGFGGGWPKNTQPMPDRSSPGSRVPEEDAPPPIPTSSRPSAAQIDGVSKRPAAVAAVPAPPVAHPCWVCRDWSGPDGVAAKYPRESLPRTDPSGYLARVLCDPFPSYTDKARAIFTWFHHNVFYDTKSFFSGNIPPQTADGTILGGWAVCAGYAEGYAAIARKAGLECVVVVGHGKGYGYTALKPGERPPPAKPDGHAWNAVRIDGGDWKLIDACWGAGHICGNNNLYKQEFSPIHFISPNDKFALSHFPADPRQQFRDDGRTITWEEYYIGNGVFEKPTFYTNGHEEGISESSIGPADAKISVNSGEVVRFQFSKICEHWTSDKHGLGKPPLFLLSIHGVDGRKDSMVPIETDGYWHWIDVHARDLGAPGQFVQVAMLTTIGDRCARGVSAREFLAKQGKAGMGWNYVMKWDLTR